MLLRISLILLFVSGMILFSNGQGSIGVKAGYTKAWRANIAFEDNDEYIHRNGFQFSLLAYFKVGRYLSFGIEPGFVTRVNGASFTFFEEIPNGTTLRLNYIELPLMMSGRYPLWNEKLKLNVKAGFGFAKLTSVVQTNTSIISPGPPTSFIEFSDRGIHTGLGIEYNVGRNRLFAEYGVYMGLSDVIRVNASKNRSVHLGIGYLTGF
ncbi:MAG TPA: outer membrane beta-barrel protein [Saprospiraceae bacterium]|nr:outer membrane beta-barrel protein [Saprospiraceae bacterium]